ncbi:gamma-glutamylputrescine oxidoreductase [Methanobrevibacter cuticularis]|uniref:Gamma-glutamylputrescine oxidoreductase n=1 Tax=Methanobrevibacter cuticularis TaxID=47311 RepID=A0A166D991_9EURY|nr:FAD-dependent oxidoreductase [Methanobrevibacter cuticularis]KZX15339.1 gamma-glutamylputrescine oxidoreductase [Methanobrevibacter cuticularis]
MYLGKHMPVWLDTANGTNFPHLEDEVEVDVVIVGGGIAGLSAATSLKMEGLSIAILESKRISNYITGATTAKIAVTSNLIYNYIFTNFGKEFALKFKEAYFSAFNKIPKIIDKLNIDCDYRRVPLYIFSSDEDSFDNLKSELDVLKELDIDAKIIHDLSYPFENINNGLLYEDQAEFHPKKYLNGLADFINGDGSYIFEKTKVLAIEENENILAIGEKGIFKTNENERNKNLNNDFKKNNDNKMKTIVTERGNLKAKNVLIATNSPIYDPDNLYKFLSQNKSYLLGVYTKSKFPQGMFVDHSPFHSYRSTSTEKGELVIIGGEHHLLEILKIHGIILTTLETSQKNLWM